MKVSVIIPVYNRERYICEAIDSVLAQDYGSEVEIIVVDDGSTDSTKEKVLNYGGRVSCYTIENSGVAAARNAGVRYSTGELLAFLDSDDLWKPCKLSRQVEEIASGHCEMVFGYIEHFRCPSTVGEFTQSTRPLAGVFATTLLVRRDSFALTGGFSEHLDIGEFLDWYSRAQNIGLKSEVVGDIVALRRIHDNNMSAQDKGAKQKYLQVMREHLKRRKLHVS